MAFIRKVKTASGATAVQVAYKSHGSIIRIDHIGSAHTEEALRVLVNLAKQRLQGSQGSLFDPAPAEVRVGLQESVSVLLRDVLQEQYTALGFGQLADEDFTNLCIARLVEPTSKLDSLRVLAELGIRGIDKNRLYRCLRRIVDEGYRDKLAKLCFAHARAQATGITLVLYDVTTLYFEIQKEDDEDGGNEGYRKSGMSKERRLEPQIIVGLLVDQNGFPLELQSFAGNRSEKTTILPVVEQFKKQHGLTDVTVVADAGMLSVNNLAVLDEAGYTYIVGSRLAKIPYDIAEYQKTQELADNQIITSHTATPGQRIIYQYRTKRAALDLRNIDKQITKAEKIIHGTTVAKKAKFLTVTTKDKGLNQALIDKARALAGIKGYVTNLDVPDERIISYYHQLWHVEQSFRMSKSDLRARPIFHHKRDSIEAHLTIVLAALAIGRTIERRTGMSLKQVVNLLKPIRSGTVVINGKEYPADAIVPSSAAPMLEKLTGH